MTILRDATLDLERGVNDVLGDEITYTPAGGAAITFSAWVEFDSETGATSNSSSEVDAVLIEVPVATVALPGPDDRITVTTLPGKVYAMARRSRGPSGVTWRLPLKRAPNV